MKNSNYYINYKYSNSTGTETVDETKSFKNAKYLINEYRLSDSVGKYWISQRACKS
jgi:hypothetical protein|tara:strand:+ start:1069 stop:1236 length:168 start_codon:yes stop_codon:yes gene_type:complete